MKEEYYYLGLMLFTLSYPLAQSFEHRITYHKKWYALWPASLITACVYLIWDHWFTVEGVWWFNERYILGWYLFELPLEEISFFFIVPFACIFIYEVLIYFVKKDWLQPIGKPFVYIMVPLLLVLGFYHWEKLYTSFNFIFTSLIVAVHFLVFKDRILGRFLAAYLVSLLPFMLVNGVLTGTWLDEPIVGYNNQENLGIRIGTVPIEDSVYSLGLLLLNISIYEKILRRKTFTR
ncbi:lycopene cyclase domain-containing protein [Cyclobacterium xiamenense]|uniref:Lycopene cyclase domain-containing protein n=1 Tax=Cyclobacterium xiamenense TaxID=1297121 RepID=A0A1H6WLN3_9BACT|nr:lycopene cyclase domain-containing protein [Cyclobacterium xiamenense]SEJ13690.1 lycopene cyclase domain-containing protein [Cyclobacterium xiamenense]